MVSRSGDDSNKKTAFVFLLRCLLILTYVAYFTFALSSRLSNSNRRLSSSRANNINAQYAPLLRRFALSRTRLLAAETSLILDTKNETHKSAESTFWLAVPDTNAATSPKVVSKLPAIVGLDRESGPLPPGAYKLIAEEDTITSCLLAIGIRPPVNSDDGSVVWEEGARNCQKLIDSGFNTFLMNNLDADNLEDSIMLEKITKQRRRTQKSPIAVEKQRQKYRSLTTKIRHEAEENFYRVLRQNTPLSVLRSCHFMVTLEVPPILSTEQRKVEYEQSTLPFGNGWMVRESVCDALKRTKGETIGSLILEHCEHSPYHLDVLDSLFEMKREGLIQCISTRNFPPTLLRSALSCGFDVQSNGVRGNLMNVCNLRPDSELGILCSEQGLSRHISAPLGGGLFTDAISQRIKWPTKLASEKKKIKTLLDTCCRETNDLVVSATQKRVKYLSIMGALHDLSQKYQSPVESISLRWLLQLNEGADDNIIVGTMLGMDLREQKGGLPYSRQSDLRKVLTFALDDGDMELISKVSGLLGQSQGEIPNEIGHTFQFNDKALWL